MSYCCYTCGDKWFDCDGECRCVTGIRCGRCYQRFHGTGSHCSSCLKKDQDKVQDQELSDEESDEENDKNEGNDGVEENEEVEENEKINTDFDEWLDRMNRISS